MIDLCSRKPGGFTLVELMVVAVVTLILIGAALPSLRDFLDGRRVHVAAGAFLGAVHLARSEAVHRGVRVDLAAVDDDWRRGWTVFVDRNRNREVDSGDDIVLRHPALPDGLQVESGLLDTERAYLAYDPSGRSRTDASARQPQFGTLRFRLGATRRNVVINMLGRPRLCAPAAGSDSC